MNAVEKLLNKGVFQRYIDSIQQKTPISTGGEMIQLWFISVDVQAPAE